ncbi:MAG: DUF11 domain-containing protein, partial [Gemmatimonadaceae bacterium]|nr:DUF11 domain-containing protein [Gemmatimonadaceae bacterium]
ANPTTGPTTVTDLLPAGLAFVSATGPGWSCSAAGQQVTCTHAGVIAPATSTAITLTVAVSAPAAPAVTNSASVTTPGDGNAGNNTSTVTTNVNSSPLDLAVTKTPASAFTAGRNASYQIAIANLSSRPTTSTVSVNDVLPAGLTFVSAAGTGFTCSATGQTVSCTYSPVLAPGQVVSLTLTVAVDPNLAGTVSNTATISTAGDSNPSNNSSTTSVNVGSALDLALTKAAGPLVIGSNGTFTLTVRNVGASTTRGTITITDNLATGLTFVSGGGSGFTCTASGALVTCVRTTPMVAGDVATVTLVVAVGTGAAPSVVNTATVSTPGDVNPVNDTSTTGSIPVSTPVTVPPPDLSVTKALITPAVSGSNVTFRVTVKNVGAGATTGPITIVDQLQPGLTYIGSAGAGWSCTVAGTVVTCVYPAPLAPGATTTLDLTLALASNVTLLGNTAVGSTPGDDDDDNNTGTVLPVPTVEPPDLALTKTASGPFVVGKPSTYSIVVRNVGNGATVGAITVTDTVPAGLTITGASGSGWTCTVTGRVVTCTHPGPLAGGASLPPITVNVIPTASAMPSVTNTARVTTPGDGNGTNDGDTVTTPVSGQPDLALDKQGPDSLTVGGTAPWTLTVRNTGTTATTGPIIVTDTLPAGLTFVSGSGPGFTCTASGQVVTCTRTAPPLGAGESVVIDLVTQVATTLSGPVRNVACVRTTGDTNAANDCDTHTATPAGLVDLVAFKDLTGPLVVGQQATFTLAARNVGAGPALPPIVLVDTLPPGLTFVSASGPGTTCAVLGAIVTCTRTTPLAPGETVTVTLVVNVGAAAGPRVTNCVDVRAANEQGSKANNRACAEAPVEGTGRLEISKVVSRAEVQVGDVVDYTIEVRNTGTGAVTGVVVRDVLPLGFLLESQSVRLDGVAGTPVTGAPGPELVFDVGSIPAGGRRVITYRVRVGPGARLGQNVNVAVARARGTETPPARARVQVSGGVFDERGAIVGKVYVQCDCERNAMQDAGEVGIPGVRVYLEDGTSAITDVEGKYSFYDVASRLHVVKVDRTTLPVGAVLVPLVNRNAGDGYSRLADVKAGELHRADFADGSRSAEVLERVLERRRAGEVSAAGEPTASSLTGLPLSARADRQPPTSAYVPPPIAPLTESNSQLPVTPLRAAAQQARATPSVGSMVSLEALLDGAATHQAPADGRTQVRVRVRALDPGGSPRAGTLRVTLESSLGRWLDADRNATQEGTQVDLVDGEGTFTLVTAARPGHGEVRVTTDDASTTIPMTFVPVNRPMLVSGLLNARVDFLDLVRGGLAVGASERFEDELRDGRLTDDSARTRAGARAALLMKGTVLDDRLLTLSYDSERDRGRTFFRDIRPDDAYPIHGDASMREYDAQSRRRFYARLDKGTSYTMYGDFQTTRADDRRILSAYDRSLTGAVQHLEGRAGSATLFASRGRIRQSVVELPGRGISGPYAIDATGLVNSERVEIIVRDRNQPSLILRRTPMVRFADYTLETGTGRIIFRAPVPSADANLNPTSVRVTFETEDGASEAFWVYGFDASVRAGTRAEIGGTFARDEGPATSHDILGLNASARLGAGTTLLGEYARTKDAVGATGDAQRVELRHQSASLEARVFAVRSDAGFANRSSVFAGGRTEIGGRFTRQLTEGTRLVGEALRSETSALADARREGALLAIERQFTPAVRGELGYRYARDDTPSAGSGMITDATDRDVSAVRARVHVALPRETRTSLFGEIEQDVRESDQRRVALGGEYILANRARLYGRHEILSGLTDPYAPNAGADRNVTVFGIDADYLRNTHMFSEYRARDAFAGRDAEASIGLRNRATLAPGLVLNTSFERVSPLATTGTERDKALAVTGAIEWTRPDLWKTTARLERRDASTGDNTLASFGYARKLSRDWTLIARTLWDDFDATVDQTRSFSQFGLAWRETDRNRWNALARYEQRFERYSEALGASRRDLAHIVAAAVNYQPVQRFTLSGRYAAKAATNSINGVGTHSTAQLFMGRGVLDLSSRFDLGAIGSLLTSDGFADRRYGLGGELGLILMKNLRVAGGYNLFGFTDRDLNSFGTTRRGPYVELGFKFDEALFGAGATRDGGSRQ